MVDLRLVVVGLFKLLESRAISLSQYPFHWNFINIIFFGIGNCASSTYNIS